MKKNLSKLKNKVKAPERKSFGQTTGQEDENSMIDSIDTPTYNNHKFQIYNINANSTKNAWPKTQGDPSYDKSISSTSESDPDRLPDRIRRSLVLPRGREEDNKTCITVPGEGKGNVRIVGTDCKRNKQVEFAPLDAVYGTPNPSEEESDEEQQQTQQRVSAAPNLEGSKQHGGAQPTMAMPMISVNIESSQEQMSNNKSNGDERLLRLKQHLFENGTIANPENVAPEHDVLGSMEKGNGRQRSEMKENSSKNNAYNVDETGNGAADLQKALGQMIKMSSHSNNPNETGENAQALVKLEDATSKNKYSDKPFNSGVMTPLIYLATFDRNNTLALGQLQEKTNNNGESFVAVASDSGRKSVSLKKSVSKASKKKVEVRGSKISLQKSRRANLKSTIPKPTSAISKRRSSASISKVKGSGGSVSRPSKQYVIRNIVVIPEEHAQVHPARSDLMTTEDIPEETVLMTEQEIGSHEYNGTIREKSERSTALNNKGDTMLEGPRDTDSSFSWGEFQGLKKRIPCLYHPSTSTVNDDGRNKNNGEETAKTLEVRNLESKKDRATGKLNRPSIEIDPQTHEELMRAISAASGKERIIALPTTLTHSGRGFTIDSSRPNSIKKKISFVETIMEEDTLDEMKNNIHNKNVKPIKIVSTDDTETDHTEILEGNVNRTYNPYQAATTLAYPMLHGAGTPLRYTHDPEFESYNKPPNNYKNWKNVDESKLYENDQRKSGKGKKVKSTTMSLSEPLIKEISDHKELNQSEISSGKKKVRRQNKRNSTSSKGTPQTPDQMVYVGRMPNTTYNVFFAPDASTHHPSEDIRKTKSDSKRLSTIKSEKLLALGPKAILIFVNKKTELNRNPFDGNVMYDDDNYGGDSYRGQGKRTKDRDSHVSGRDSHGKGRDSHGSGRDSHDKGRDSKNRRQTGDTMRSTKSGKSGKSRKSQRSTKSKRDSEFDVSSMRDPGGRPGEEGAIVEKSPSGLKTVVKYPCGCMKITKINPDDESVTNEITSAFCRLGSKCDISRAQADKLMLRLEDAESRRGTSSTKRTKYSDQTVLPMPASPQLDIVIEGMVSKKPIKAEPPAQRMKGANLTGTLTIKTNRCNGVFNLYIDPRVKSYLRNNLACLQQPSRGASGHSRGSSLRTGSTSER